MGYTPEICIICEKRNPKLDLDVCLTSSVIEDELRDLRVFMCKILGIPSSYFEYSGFPICKDCTSTRIKNLLEIHNELITLRISYTSLKEKLLKDIITVYFKRNIKLNQSSPVKARLKETIIQKWQDYSVDFPLLPLNDNETNDVEEINFSPQDEIKEEPHENPLYDEDGFNDELPEGEQLMHPRLMSEDEFLLNDPLEENRKSLHRRRSRRINSRKKRTSLNIIQDDETDTANENHSTKVSWKRKSSKAKDKAPKAKVENSGLSRYKKKLPLRKCPQCPMEMRGRIAIGAHIRTHMGERPFKCSDCDQSFRQLPHLNTHKKLKHGYVGESKTIEGLNDVASKNRCYYCNLCCSQNKYKGHYLRHLMKRHMGKQIREGESFWFYYCDAKDCLFSCTDQDSLKKHFKESHESQFNLLCPEFPQCDICQRVFAMQDNLDIHKSCHHSGDSDKQTLLGCNYCYQVFESENKLNEHLPRHQVTCDVSQIFCHLCDVCGKGYKTISPLIFHKRVSHNNVSKPCEDNQRKYECGLCFKWYKNRSHLTYHLKSYHLDKDIKGDDSFWFHNCDVKECRASCANEEQLLKHFQTRHIDISGGGKFHPCNNCQRVFALQENLEQHQNCHSKDLGDLIKFGCDFCPDLFLSDSERNEHRSQHKIELSKECNVCFLCEKLFEDVASLCHHNRLVHRKGFQKRDTFKRKINCVECNQLVSIACMKQHIMYKHTRRNNFCTLCPFNGSTPTSLQLHIEKIHPEVETPHKLLRYCCQYCEKRFYMTTELHKHSIRYHASEYLKGNSFCRSCFVTFETEEEMKDHFKAQHSDLICSVETCGKTFSDKKKMWLHMNTHKKSKPFLCEFCPQGFAQEASLQYHINRKHTFHRSFFCKLCPENPGYYERVTFKKHMETDHPTCTVKDILITKYPRRKYFF